MRLTAAVHDRPPECRRPDAGFTLIATVSILILLSLVAVGMLTLSTLTIRSSKLGGAKAEARANARLALMLAIGDLQKAAGPDQRVTALADIAASDGGSDLAAGQDPVNDLALGDPALDPPSKGLSPLHPGTRYWTGVFSNRDAPETIFEKTPAPRIERWLVSGFDDPGAPDPTITPGLESCIVGTDGKVSDPSRAAVLVGPHTAGSGTGSEEHYVAAPMVEMDTGAAAGLKGAFAYWVGDEGVKARINMERRNDDPDSYASLVAQRRGWETVAGFEDYPPATGDEDEVLPGVITLPTADLLLPAVANGNPSPRQAVFHSATTASRGLVVDTLHGGTRVDLTAALSRDLPPNAPDNAYDNFPLAGGRVIPQGRFSRLSHLTWDHLGEFFQRRTELTDDVLMVRERSSTGTAAIAPVVTDFRILLGVRLEPKTQRGQPKPRYLVHACGKIAVAIANPYSLPMEWDDDIVFEIKNQTPAGNRVARIWQIQEARYFSSDATLDRPGRESAVFNQALFRIKPGRLEPGEARAYTQGDVVKRTIRDASRPQVVDMQEFVDASPFDFSRCVEMDTQKEISLPRTMDVRESWQTTLLGLEMRLGTSPNRYKWLRRIERFELDNGYFAPNQRRFDENNMRGMRGPVPLMLYSFQVSQPGVDYLSLMPRGYEWGQRASTLRTFTDFNLRATNFRKPITSYNPPPYFMESNDSAALLPFRRPGGDTGRGFTRNLVADPMPWGRSATTGSRRTLLFSVPRQFTSLAQLQHADLTNDDDDLSVGHQPGNAVGNSYASPFVKRSEVQARRIDYEIIGSRNHSGATRKPRNYYDIAHILNNSLWDRYFFSTIPPGGKVPENPALIVAPGTGASNLNDPVEAGGALEIDGAFNINSTNKDAWKAFLASARNFTHRADTTPAPEAAFPRSLEQLAAAVVPPTGEGEDSFSGFRRVTDDELDLLATEIVKQVRLRGPFVSLAHFVNRALGDIRRERELTRCGALQFALDESGININFDGRRSGFTRLYPNPRGTQIPERVTLARKQGAPRADLDGGDLANRPADANRREPDWAMTSRDNNFGAVASILADRVMLLDDEYRDEQGYRSTGIPGWVTQADVLQVIGPSISARSDTFRIRTRGEARDAAGNVIASAFCEAIVQRQTYFVDRSNAPHDRPSVLTPANEKYGRKFEVVAFRWLSPEDI